MLAAGGEHQARCTHLQPDVLLLIRYGDGYAFCIIVGGVVNLIVYLYRLARLCCFLAERLVINGKA